MWLWLVVVEIIASARQHMTSGGSVLSAQHRICICFCETMNRIEPSGVCVDFLTAVILCQQIHEEEIEIQPGIRHENAVHCPLMENVLNL